MGLSRRTLVKLGVVSCGFVAATGTVLYVKRDLIRELQPEVIVTRLRSTFDYLTLNIEDEKFEEFATLYREHYYKVKRETWHNLRDGDDERYARVIEHLDVTFLMSTDFFLNGADESRPVNYVMFYHPYISPCWNPLSAG